MNIVSLIDSIDMAKINSLTLEPGFHIHLVGIGGFGLSAIARVLLGRGYRVSGSDEQMSEITSDLKSAGAEINHGHRSEIAGTVDIVLVSSAISQDNPEVVAARAADIPVLKRSEFIGLLMANDTGIAVAGTHGKTTTTGMISQILVQGKLDPSVIVGGVLPFLGSNGRAGSGEYFLVEADEYDHMFLGLDPQISVITNVEYDHPDLFPTISDYRQAFKEFIAIHRGGSLLVVGVDDQSLLELVNETAGQDVRIVTYGLDRGDWRALEPKTNQFGGTDFVVHKSDQIFGLFRLRIPGWHNVQNALAAIAVAASLGLDYHIIREALAQFGGVNRRFQVIGEVGPVTIVDDYAHHPREIIVTLAAARQRFPGRRIWAVWQPHTYSRIKSLDQEFSSAFSDADRVIVMPIYESRESDDLGLTGPEIVDSLDHKNASYQPTAESTSNYILDRILPGDVVITLTAGDGNIVGKMVLSALQRRLEESSNNGNSHWLSN
jgi:UDP-N-acetylmuramate--alanine ligase